MYDRLQPRSDGMARGGRAPAGQNTAILSLNAISYENFRMRIYNLLIFSSLPQLAAAEKIRLFGVFPTPGFATVLDRYDCVSK